MEFVRGGELYANMKRMPSKRFTEQQVRFYIASIAVALGYLHDKGIVYRDLKPENVLIQEDGYIVLADFGLAKTLEAGEVTKTFCGTPDYLAPEIV